jgi:hypothetical protein
MRTRFAAVVCSTIGLIGASGSAFADTIGRYECTIFAAPNQEPIGDRPGHSLLSFQYTCLGVDGLLKGAVYTASSVSEWDGPQGTYLLGSGIHRAPGGFAITQLVEGTGSVVMKDGKPVGVESAGKAVVKFASGPLTSLAGKNFKFATRPTGLSRFTLELTD